MRDMKLFSLLVLASGLNYSMGEHASVQHDKPIFGTFNKVYGSRSSVEAAKYSDKCHDRLRTPDVEKTVPWTSTPTEGTVKLCGTTCTDECQNVLDKEAGCSYYACEDEMEAIKSVQAAGWPGWLPKRVFNRRHMCAVESHEPRDQVGLDWNVIKGDGFDPCANASLITDYTGISRKNYVNTPKYRATCAVVAQRGVSCPVATTVFRAGSEQADGTHNIYGPELTTSIHGYHICDNYKDCLEEDGSAGEDEKHCLQCDRNHNMLYHPSWVCDTIDDCCDGTDEPVTCNYTTPVVTAHCNYFLKKQH
jgi:hypothetical protein